MASQKQSKSKVVAHVRMQQAMELRLAGATYRQIAETLSVSVRTAYLAVSRGLEISPKTRENALQLQTLEVLRLNRLQMRVWERFEKSEGKDYDAADLLIRIGRARADLLGLRHVNLHVSIEETPTLEGLQAELAAYQQGRMDALAEDRSDVEDSL